MSKFIFDRDKNAASFNMGIWLSLGVLMAFVSAVLRSLCYVFFFDTDPGYFTATFLTSMSDSLMVFVVAILLCGFFYIAKDAELCKSIDSADNTVFFASVFAGFIMLADFAFKVYVMIGEDKFSYYKFIFDKSYNVDNSYIVRAVAVIEIVGVLASLAAACCFFVRSSKKVNVKLSAIFGFFPIVRALVGIAQIYFEMEIQMNHPSKLMLQFALISLMLFFLAEERYFISDTHMRPRRYFIFGCVAMYLSFVGGVSEMVGFFSGKLGRGDFCVEAFVCLTFSIYVFARIKAFALYVPEIHQPEAIADVESLDDTAGSDVSAQTEK